jgi:hypothetical protein
VYGCLLAGSRVSEYGINGTHLRDDEHRNAGFLVPDCGFGLYSDCMHGAAIRNILQMGSFGLGRMSINPVPPVSWGTSADVVFGYRMGHTLGQGGIRPPESCRTLPGVRMSHGRNRT